MADQLPLPVRVAQTVGLTASGLLAGVSLSFSVIAVPRILESPAPILLKQWTNLYNEGKLAVPPVAILTGAVWGYLAYETGRTGEQGKYWAYVAAGVLTAVMVPYTVVFMRGTNNKLLGMGNLSAEAVIKGDSVHQLVDWWGVLNLGRAAALLAGTLVGAWTVVN